ncbi:DNA repair protein XRCC3-like [Octopus sinensis]|uniref:DNA repair protein XRCC3-like n=1 Tax=Octopus sinensis TaxID=2607531 RepID=A0A6P7U8X5_9MOLL|nr:DNA repair protein XRCC3-like [Octopus sinensis]
MSFGIFNLLIQESLIKCLKTKIEGLFRRFSVPLIIIDSVAGVFRGDENVYSAPQKARQICQLGLVLQSLQRRTKGVILCLNQVADCLEEFIPCKIPALGLTWAHFMTGRVMLTRHCTSPSVGTSRRTFTVISGPNLPPACADFVIDAFGFHFV